MTTERDPTTGRAVRYARTAKGIDLMPMMLEVIAWSAKYDPNTAAEPDFVQRLGSDRQSLERDVCDQLDSVRSATAPRFTGTAPERPRRRLTNAVS